MWSDVSTVYSCCCCCSSTPPCPQPKDTELPCAVSLPPPPPLQAERPEFTQVMCGNRVLTEQGSRPAAHCYCGYQFGYFAGQLGDGAGVSA